VSIAPTHILQHVAHGTEQIEQREREFDRLLFRFSEEGVGTTPAEEVRAFLFLVRDILRRLLVLLVLEESADKFVPRIDVVLVLL
jgi:hypothetical protein